MKRILAGFAIAVIALFALIVSPLKVLAANQPDTVAVTASTQTLIANDYTVSHYTLQGLTAGIMTAIDADMTAGLTDAAPERVSGSLDRSTERVTLAITKSVSLYSIAATKITNTDGASNADPPTSASTATQDIGSASGNST